MEDPLRDFLFGIVALEIGLFLFWLRRKFPQYHHFFDSMTILMLFMAAVSPTIGILSEHKGFMYFFIPIFLAGANGWLFFARYVIFDKDNWHGDISFKPVRTTYLTLIGLFFPGAILLVIFIPISNLALP